MSGRTIQGALSSANTEQVQDIVGGMFQNAAGITWTYNDAAGTITPATDHGGIGGLADDDHTQYALLAGRAGGQTLTGGTAASQNLRLEGTVHATPGTVYTSASSFGVGGIPTAKMHVFAGATAGGGLQVDGTSSPRLRVSDTGSSVHNTVQVDGAAAYAGSGSNHPYVLRVNDTEAARFNTSRSFGIGTGTTVDRRFHVEEDSATTDAVTYVGRFTRTSSGTPANGIGVGLEFEVETAAGNNEIGATIEAVATDVTNLSEDFALDLKVAAAGAAATTKIRLNGNGNHGWNTTDVEAWHANYGGIQLGPYAGIFFGTAVTGLFLQDNSYYDGQHKYRTTNSATQIAINNGLDVLTAVSGTIDTAFTYTSQLTVYGTGTLGVTVGAPTGGAKGLGTLNAQAVYDDNVLLTCYVLDQALDGAIDIPKWDAKVPARKTKGPDGAITSVEARVHEPVRKFAARIGTMYDPLNLDKFWQHIVDKRHLTAYPNEIKYDPFNGKQDLGNWQQQTIELLEIYAVHIHKLNTRLKALENSGTTTTIIT